MASSPTVLASEFPGFTVFKIEDLGAGTPAVAEKDIAGGPCTLHHLHLSMKESSSAEAVYIKLYDDLNPTVGTTHPVECIQLVASVAAYRSDKSWPINPPNGLYFENGLSITCVTGAGTAGTTEPTADVLAVAVVVPD